MNVSHEISDPVTLVDSLDPDTIRAKLAELDAQQRALMSLLRVAQKRRRRPARKQRGKRQ